MTAEELIKILQQYPQDAQIFVSHLCMGWIMRVSNITKI